MRRKKSDGGLPTKKNLLVVYANAMKNRAPMTVKEYLMDQGHPEALVVIPCWQIGRILSKMM